ncbi:hypothetical protein ACQ4M3_40570 [Leptolyngbya sp. AN03gr2]|uniref:hypothetical protein n=1 Tax=unclassified Leptolyngbya TaxID=2650499 RepID=UPI003D3222B9
MGAFSWLQNALEEHRQNSCETTPETKHFVDEYSKQVEAEKQSLRERQEKEREDRSEAKKDR